MSGQRTDEGRRVLRNVASFGGFLMSPVAMFLLIRAVGPAGYGRWWWTLVVLEVASVLGNLGAELYVRREVPRLTREGRDDDVIAVVGSAIAVAGIGGAILCAVQIAIAAPLARTQGDPGLIPFVQLLAIGPLLGAINGVLGAALQSRDILTSVAVVRGIVMPLVNAGMLLLTWQLHLAIVPAVLLMDAVTVISLVLIVVLYAQHLSLARTLRAALQPRFARATIRYGAALVGPALLFTIGGKIDLYVLGGYSTPLIVGVYAACLQMSSSVINIRALFDPIVQAQIGALHGVDKPALAVSLRRLARLCAFGMAPAFVVTLAVGEPILSFLIGRPSPIAVSPLAILTVGNLLASVAVASWLVPMLFAGRPMAAVALGAGIIKVVLLFVLVPRYGIVGAAIATAVGMIVAWFAQAWIGGRDLGARPYSLDVIPVLIATAAIGAGGRALFVMLRDRGSELVATGVALVAVGLAVLAILPWLLTADERAQVRRFLRRAP